MRIDRDLNAALVLSQYGEVNQNAKGKAVPEFTLVNWKSPTDQVEARTKHHPPPSPPWRGARGVGQVLPSFTGIA